MLNSKLQVKCSNIFAICYKAEFAVARQKGSHIILTKQTETGKKAVVVPNHKEVDKGTLLEIIRQAGLTKEDFLKLL